MNKYEGIKLLLKKDYKYKTPVKKNKKSNYDCLEPKLKRNNKKKFILQKIIFYDEKTQKKYTFPLLDENKLELPKNFQKNIKNINEDDDNDTDEETLKYSINYCNKELIKDIKTHKKNKKLELINKNNEKINLSFSKLLSIDKDMLKDN